ncbi:MAG: hypothetical protein JWQ02_1407 [Capsulimonas sp.]|nr:hypothetical protein [Capsulimonas sp.]
MPTRSHYITIHENLIQTLTRIINFSEFTHDYFGYIDRFNRKITRFPVRRGWKRWRRENKTARAGGLSLKMCVSMNCDLSPV